LKRVKQNRGVKIPNARVWAGWDKGIYLKNRRLARKRAMRAGKKEGVLGVLCPQEFLPARRNFRRNSCPPPQAAG